MEKFPQLRILHVSDLHFNQTEGRRSEHICDPADPTASREGTPSLAALIKNDLASDYWKQFEWAVGPSRTIVAATGDLTETANPSEFDRVDQFLKELTAGPILGSDITVENVFVVPGNHDVIFDAKDAAHRFGPYCNFYNKFFQALLQGKRPIALPHEAERLSRVLKFEEGRFLVAEINSCYYVQNETIDKSRGQVDAAAIARLRLQLAEASSISKDWIKIALIHHHPVLLPSFVEAGRGVDAVLNARSLLTLLREHGFQLVLHGHKHFPQVFSYDPDPAWSSIEAPSPQLIVAGGSAGSISLPEGAKRCNTYNFIVMKWIPNALQARVQIITRGLVRLNGDGEMDVDQWRWETLRVYDKILSPFANYPLPGRNEIIPFPPEEDALEIQRKSEYGRLRGNMPVAEVFPSLTPGQGYEVRAWLEPHRNNEPPVEVVWSAGEAFGARKVGTDRASRFSVSFHYWGPMLIQAEMRFNDGKKVVATVYARLPDRITRR